LGCGGTGDSTNLHKQRDAIETIWSKIPEEYCQHLIESRPPRIRYLQCVPNKVAGDLYKGNKNENETLEGAKDKNFTLLGRQVHHKDFKFV